MKRSVISVLLAVLASFSVAAKADSLTPTKAEEQEFRLTSAKVKSMANAYSNLLDLLGSDPKLAAIWKTQAAAAGRDDHANGRDSISLTVRRLYASDARIAAAFTKAGTSPKEAGMAMEAIVGSMIGVAMAQASGTAVNVPAGSARDNLAFAQAHQAEIKAAMAQISATASRYPNLNLSEANSDGQ